MIKHFKRLVLVLAFAFSSGTMFADNYDVWLGEVRAFIGQGNYDAAIEALQYSLRLLNQFSERLSTLDESQIKQLIGHEKMALPTNMQELMLKALNTKKLSEGQRVGSLRALLNKAIQDRTVVLEGVQERQREVLEKLPQQIKILEAILAQLDTLHVKNTYKNYILRVGLTLDEEDAVLYDLDRGNVAKARKLLQEAIEVRRAQLSSSQPQPKPSTSSLGKMPVTSPVPTGSAGKMPAAPASATSGLQSVKTSAPIQLMIPGGTADTVRKRLSSFFSAIFSPTHPRSPKFLIPVSDISIAGSPNNYNHWSNKVNELVEGQHYKEAIEKIEYVTRYLEDLKTRLPGFTAETIIPYINQEKIALDDFRQRNIRWGLARDDMKFALQELDFAIAENNTLIKAIEKLRTWVDDSLLKRARAFRGSFEDFYRQYGDVLERSFFDTDIEIAPYNVKEYIEKVLRIKVPSMFTSTAKKAVKKQVAFNPSITERPILTRSAQALLSIESAEQAAENLRNDAQAHYNFIVQNALSYDEEVQGEVKEHLETLKDILTGWSSAKYHTKGINEYKNDYPRNQIIQGAYTQVQKMIKQAEAAVEQERTQVPESIQDFKKGLGLSEKYANVYANSLVKQMVTEFFLDDSAQIISDAKSMKLLTSSQESNDVKQWAKDIGLLNSKGQRRAEQLPQKRDALYQFLKQKPNYDNFLKYLVLFEPEANILPLRV